jgi:hypothetical protein
VLSRPEQVAPTTATPVTRNENHLPNIPKLG